MNNSRKSIYHKTSTIAEMKFELIRDSFWSLFSILGGDGDEGGVADSSNDNSNRFSITKAVILTDWSPDVLSSPINCNSAEQTSETTSTVHFSSPLYLYYHKYPRFISLKVYGRVWHPVVSFPIQDKVCIEIIMTRIMIFPPRSVLKHTIFQLR